MPRANTWSLPSPCSAWPSWHCSDTRPSHASSSARKGQPSLKHSHGGAMIEDLVTHSLVLAQCLGAAARARRHGAKSRGDGGMSPLEVVIIALGLMAVAALLVTAITAAVTRRTDQLK